MFDRKRSKPRRKSDDDLGFIDPWKPIDVHDPLLDELFGRKKKKRSK